MEREGANRSRHLLYDKRTFSNKQFCQLFALKINKNAVCLHISFQTLYSRLSYVIADCIIENKGFYLNRLHEAFFFFQTSCMSLLMQTSSSIYIGLFSICHNLREKQVERVCSRLDIDKHRSCCLLFDRVDY